MHKKFFNAIYPARDGRDTIPHAEVVARAAYTIINEDSAPEQLYAFEAVYGDAPRPNRSARVEGRKRVSPNGEWVTVRGSKAFFQSVEDWIKEEVD